jgi:hypothetical protein
MLDAVLTIINSVSYIPFVLADLGSEIGDNIDELANGTAPVAGSGLAALTDFIGILIKIAMPVAILCLLLLMGYGAFLMTTSQGNPEKLNEAKEVITNALIGFAVIVSSGAILIAANSILNLGISY